MLADDLAAALPELRAQAESRMTSTVTVRHKTGRTVQDETSGREVPEWVDVYTGRFRLGSIPQGSGPFRTIVAGGAEVQASVRVGHFPAGTTGLGDGDLIDITAGENAGTVWQITESDPADQQTALRLPIFSVQRPTEWA